MRWTVGRGGPHTGAMGERADEFAMERKLAKLTKERDEARGEVEALRAELDAMERRPRRSAAYEGEIVHTTTSHGAW